MNKKFIRPHATKLLHYLEKPRRFLQVVGGASQVGKTTPHVLPTSCPSPAYSHVLDWDFRKAFSLKEFFLQSAEKTPSKQVQLINFSVVFDPVSTIESFHIGELFVGDRQNIDFPSKR